jgi:hypothetical protein
MHTVLCGRFYGQDADNSDLQSQTTLSQKAEREGGGGVSVPVRVCLSMLLPARNRVFTT